MTAPIMLGVMCRWCGAQRIEVPWDTREGYHCAACGATNWPPLLSVPRVSPRVMSDRFLGNIPGAYRGG